MKFRAERAAFADAVAWAQRTVGDRASLPAMSGIKLEVTGDRLTLSSTNVEMDSELSVPVQGQQDGAALVFGKLLAEVVRTLPHEAVNAEATGDALHLACGRARFNLRLMQVEDFPALKAAGEDAAEATIKAGEFARTVAQVARSASSDDARPVLTGVSLEATPGTLTAVATDAYRLAMRTVPWDQGADITVLVPRRALEQARHAAELLGSEVRLRLEPSQATFEFSDRRLVSRLIEGTFPNVRQLIPDGFDRRLVVERSELFEVVKRVAVVGDLNTTVTPVTLDLSADTLVVKSVSGEVGQAEESMAVEYEGDPLQIAFNPRYLADGLEAAGGEQVGIEMRDEVKPAVIRPLHPEDADPSGAEFMYLLMPVRV